MTALGNIRAGTRATASMLQGVAPLAAIKPANESVTSATLQPDNDLFLPVQASATYVISGYLIASGATIGTGDIQWELTAPSGSTIWYTGTGYSTTGTTPSISPARGSLSIAFGVNGASTSPVIITGQVTVGSTAGSLALLWAQNTGNTTTATVLHAGSWLTAWQIA